MSVAKQVWYPEEGDTVKMMNGASGMISSEYDPESEGEGSWKVSVELAEDEIESDISVEYDEKKKCWEEVK